MIRMLISFELHLLICPLFYIAEFSFCCTSKNIELLKDSLLLMLNNVVESESLETGGAVSVEKTKNVDNADESTMSENYAQ